MPSFSELLAQLDPDSSRRARQFEQLCRWYLLNAPEYGPMVKQVWLWDEWPDRWGADAGIDLVVETASGELWAVQAKAYNPSYAIKKADIDSFLSESAHPQFTYRLLIATTDLIGATARRTIAHQEKPASLLLRSQLEAEQLEWPVSLADLRPIQQERKSPLAHQEEAVETVCTALKHADRGQLIMACGTGKTLVALWAAERLRSERTLVLLPSLSLLAQTLREWTANTSSPFKYLAVCSDETVAEPDAFVTSTSELRFPATTDAAEIASFLSWPGRLVVFSTYQSSPRVAAAQDGGAPTFDLVVADEAHRCAGHVSSAFATVLDRNRIRSRRRLFMTATPRYFTGRVRHEAAQMDIEIASMDDEEHFGPVLHRLAFAEAISQELLSDYQVLVIAVSAADHRDLAERGAIVTTDGTSTTDARTLASQLTLLKAMRTYDLRRVVSFHSRVRRARDFSSSLPGIVALLPSDQRPSGHLHCDFVSGEMPSGQRDSRLARFRNLDQHERALLANARCLGEGVDIPALDGVAFIDPRRSQIEIVQAVGRAIRRSPEKKIGTIILPILIDADADPAHALEDSSFNNVWDVLKALRAHDDELGEQLDELRRELGRQSTNEGRPAKIRLDLPTRVGEDFIRAFNARLVEETTATWEFWFGLVHRFVAREGHADVPRFHQEEHSKLGQWVSGQRTAYRVGRIPAERAARLAALPGWVWHTYDVAWERGFLLLERCATRRNDTRLPRDYAEDGYPLGQWLHEQRKGYRGGRLSTERARRLQALPNWSWDIPDAAWEDGYSRLQRFAAREGNTQVPQSYVDGESGFALGQWVSRQRRFFAEDRLSAERLARLEKLPAWTWDILDASWERGFSSIKRFVAREHHASIPATHVEDGYRLGTWIQHQRSAYRAGRLTNDRAARLAALPGWSWTPYDAAWEEGFSCLERFAARESHALVPTNHVEDGHPLGQWVAHQRRAHRLGRLSDARAALLIALPGWAWNRNDAAWEEGYSRLERFAIREQHTRIPSKHVEDSHPLGQWVSEQRKNCRAGRLSTERVARLNAVPGWTWVVTATDR